MTICEDHRWGLTKEISTRLLEHATGTPRQSPRTIKAGRANESKFVMRWFTLRISSFSNLPLFSFGLDFIEKTSHSDEETNSIFSAICFGLRYMLHFLCSVRIQTRNSLPYVVDQLAIVTAFGKPYVDGVWTWIRFFGCALRDALTTPTRSPKHKCPNSHR